MEPVGIWGPYPILTEVIFQSHRLFFQLCPLAQTHQSTAINRKGMKAPAPAKKKSPFYLKYQDFIACAMANNRRQSGKAAPQAGSVSKLVKLWNKVCPLCVHVF